MKPYALICVALVTADQLLKQLLPTPYWGWHPGGYSWYGLTVGFAAVAVLVAYPPIRLGGTIMLAGMVGNVVSVAHGAVANPFLIGSLAFNLADLMLLTGFLVICGSAMGIARDIRARGLARGWK
jgi:hypothetical protein